MLVVQNLVDPGSRRLAAAYAREYRLAADQIATIAVPNGETIGRKAYRERIEEPVRRHLQRTGRTRETDFILLTRGVPLRVRETGGSVDALLAAMELPVPAPRRRDPASLARAANPYFGAEEPFRHARYGLYLVTRLDGYTERQARDLLRRARAARPVCGPFLIDLDPSKTTGGYGVVTASMGRAGRLLAARGFDARVDSTAAFAALAEPLAGYYSWGSNDGGFSPRTWRSLRFLPGAIAETAVSTSGRTFRRTTGGQSLVADLVEAGVTGVKGYVSEPLTAALCPADLLFDRYTRGFTLAEAFWAATPVLKWKDVVLGDPLCAPYAAARRD